MQEKSYEERVAEAKTRIREVTPRQAVSRRDDGTVFLDVRDPQEWNLFRIPGAVHVPLGVLNEQVSGAVGRGKPVIVYCARGNRSALAADAMQQLGYDDVTSLAEGIRGWMEAGGDVEG